MAAMAHRSVLLKDYTPPDFIVDAVEMDVDLDPLRTVIRCTQTFRRRPGSRSQRLKLNGRGFELLTCSIDGLRLAPSEMERTSDALVLDAPGETFTLFVETVVSPQANRSALGLFLDGEAIITHMEPDGMSLLTYCQDRPDSLSRYKVRLRADPGRFPVLLSNGRLVEKGSLVDGRHFATWQDDTPKPAYIFAIAAGRYVRVADQFTRRDGKVVDLGAYVAENNAARCDFLLGALRRSMAWDEQVYGRVCDIETFNVVVLDRHAISQENKGLMFLEASYALADPVRSTDEDFDLVERITAHEYFHNWTGNRVTCRDWFQLSLKEGLTRFRDQEFSASMSAPAVKRISTVRSLRTNQFPEDMGGGAHPVRPQSYVAVSNLYTPTVYDKGAEIIRMAHLLLGADAFRAGLDLYFVRHDLSAVTIEDLLAALSDASGRDLSQFSRWYDQRGTPVIHIDETYDAASRSLSLRIRQTDARGALLAPLLHMPLRIGLVGADGVEVAVKSDRLRADGVLELKAGEETIVLQNVPAGAALSCNRGFSAPVRILAQRSPETLSRLLASDPDGFARWDAGQELMVRATLERAGRAAPQAGEGSLDVLVSAMGRVLRQKDEDLSLVAELLTFPQIGLVANGLSNCNMDTLATAWTEVRKGFARTHADDLHQTFKSLEPHGAFSNDPVAKGQRRLRAVALEYLLELETAETRRLALAEVSSSANMTACSAALYALCNYDCPERIEALDQFRRRWAGEDDMMKLWFRTQALSRYPGAASRVRELSRLAPFDINNVPYAMALFGGFFRQNRIAFHAGDGSGYRLLGDTLLELDRIRPGSTKWIMPQFMIWRQLDAPRQALICEQLERIAATPNISSVLFENVTRALQSPVEPAG
ncbi:MAG: aminopeptidase N [Hyphomonadaceae bacterium]